MDKINEGKNRKIKRKRGRRGDTESESHLQEQIREERRATEGVIEDEIQETGWTKINKGG